MDKWEEQQIALHEPFDFARHKRLFTNYLEVVILTDGTVEYAVPSHTEKLLRVIRNKTGESSEEIYARTPPEFYFDMHKWLCMESGCIMVWDRFYVGKPNSAQLKTLKRLKLAQLYLGQA